ncbi:hypothetical protein GWI33_020530 [Rhynchophorus ferrugineus]|uniref:Uncharacterized protein n=1 Tax=Rhynchophorus ferrugineus TaxID=354439 RepID=A0A834M447_RHYFE|nr:hypothetical protein GWI33_020530 [Rhynchophorus ferrugineus]
MGKDNIYSWNTEEENEIHRAKTQNGIGYVCTGWALCSAKLKFPDFPARIVTPCMHIECARLPLIPQRKFNLGIINFLWLGKIFSGFDISAPALSLCQKLNGTGKKPGDPPSRLRPFSRRFATPKAKKIIEI